MKYYAVIDTNVIVAALLTKNKDSANDEYPSPERARINAFGIAYRNAGYAFFKPCFSVVPYNTAIVRRGVNAC